jgi:type IV pilus assembly protein PilV
MRRPQSIAASRSGARTHGFTLVEVLVALIIISVGMLGIAKIQALAYASTGTASLRSLAAIEAASLAASMRANRNYWTVPVTPLTITITGTTITKSDAALAGSPVCVVGAGGYAGPCTAPQLAASDLQTWVTSLNALLPGVQGSVSCPTPSTANGFTAPVGCTIQLSWVERNVGINTQSQNTTMTLPTYTMYVEP